MATNRVKVGYECREELAAWFRAHCPCAFDDPQFEFYRGTLFIIEREVERHRA